MSDHLAIWQQLVDADDPKTAVAAHLAFLTETEECHRLLGDLMEQFVAVRIASDDLHIVFRDSEYDDEHEVTLRAPYVGDDVAGLPASVVAVIRVHSGIDWEAGGGGAFGFYGSPDSGFDGSGNWEYEALEEADEANAELLTALADAGLGPKAVKGCCDFGQNWLIWNPVDRNTRGEPTVYFVSHGNCVAVPVPDVRELGYGPLLLRVLAWNLLHSKVLAPAYN